MVSSRTPPRTGHWYSSASWAMPHPRDSVPSAAASTMPSAYSARTRRVPSQAMSSAASFRTSINRRPNKVASPWLAQHPAHAGATLTLEEPFIAWPVCCSASFGRLLRLCWSPTAVLLIPLGDTSNVTANATGGSSSNSHEQCVGQHCGQECHSSVLPTEDASKVPQHRSTGAHKQFKNERRQDEADQRPAKWPSQTAGDGPYEQSDTGRRQSDDAGLRTEPEDDHESPAEGPDQCSNTSSCS